MNILVVLEDNNGAIHRMSLEAIVAAQEISSKLKSKITVLAMGRNADALALEASKYELNEILKINSSSLNSYSSDGYAIAIEQIILENDFRYVFFGHTYQVRDYVPKISAKLMRPFLADNIKMSISDGSIEFTKQTFNAKLLADIQTSDSGLYLVSFQSASFSSDDLKSGSSEIKKIDINIDESQIKNTYEEPFQESAGGVDLTSADIIVSVGRGIGEADNISIAKDLALALGGQLSSSRPVVDAGWLSPDHQVGSSGQSVSPKLYLALGISGAIQHVVGMKGSKNIVAINKDPEAPIFEIANYGIVGDIFEIVPKLIESLK
ncbi:electron transfer flavoprotein subunit alpha [bacterium]|nr:MAG: electron transfer flavoprotein subunit alpha [bacterium]